MVYSCMQDFSSLVEVFTAIYVSMFLDEILINIWTPDYKDRISQMIKSMNIPAVSYLEKKVKDNIGVNADDIRGHMKRKALFFFVYCMSLLLIAGLENHSENLQKHGYLIITILSVTGAILTMMGFIVFIKYSRVTLSVILYGIIFALLYFSKITDFLCVEYGLGWIGYKTAVCCFLTVISIPVIWQIFLIWIYSSPYKGYMQEKIYKEAYTYGKAYIAYKVRDMAALPKEYEVVARDFVAAPASEEDTSLSSLNSILVARMEALCELPNVMKVFWSWIMFNLRGRHNREAEYIAQYGFDYEALNSTTIVTPSNAGASQLVGDAEQKRNKGFKMFLSMALALSVSVLMFLRRKGKANKTV